MKHFQNFGISTDYLASGFESHGDNVFSAGNGIHIIIPQILGTRNTFDTVLIDRSQAFLKSIFSLKFELF